MADLTARITETLGEHRTDITDVHTHRCTCGADLGNDVETVDAHLATVIAALFHRREREITYGLGSLGTEKRKQVCYSTPWETQ